MPKMKRTAKDSVFTYLFKQPEYTRLLYLALHPEDSSVTEADCKVITLQNVLMIGPYNDIGIQVGSRLILLIEAQSTFSINIVLRLLLYLAETYMEYIKEHKLDLYSTVPLKIPRPELYVIYTGSKKNVPETLHLSDLFEGEGSVEMTVRVLRGGTAGDIVDQYVQFCKILDEQRKQYGYTKKTIENTIKQCIERDILAPFLRTREREVADIMSVLFDEQAIMEIHDFHIANTARQKGIQEGRQKGIQEGRQKGIQEGRQKGIQEGRQKGIQEGRQKGIQEGRQKGIQEGIEEGSKRIMQRTASLSKALTEAGRGDELFQALADQTLFEKLMEEFSL